MPPKQGDQPCFGKRDRAPEPLRGNLFRKKVKSRDSGGCHGSDLSCPLRGDTDSTEAC